MNLHTVERIDVNDRLPREGQNVLAIWTDMDRVRGMDVACFEEGEFYDSFDDKLPGVSHWVDLTPVQWNDGVPLHKAFRP